MSQSKAWRDVVGGGLLIAVGIAAVAEGSTYDLGTLSRMGTGFFPMILGGVLVMLGVMIAVGGLLKAPAVPVAGHAPPSWRGIGAIVLGVVAFIVFGKLFGLAPAAFVTVFVSALGDRTSTLKQAVVLAAALTVFSVVLFSWLLQVQLPLFQVPGGWGPT